MKLTYKQAMEVCNLIVEDKTEEAEELCLQYNKQQEGKSLRELGMDLVPELIDCMSWSPAGIFISDDDSNYEGVILGTEEFLQDHINQYNEEEG